MQDIFQNPAWRRVLSTPPLSREEEQRLAREMQEGSQEARDRLVEANLKFVAQEAKKVHRDGIPFDDLFQEGVKGLIYALESFDPEKGNKLISYAVQPIRWKMWELVERFEGVVHRPSGTAPESDPSLDASHSDEEEDGPKLSEIFDGDHNGGREAIRRRELEKLLSKALEEDVRERDARVVRLSFGLGDRAPMGRREVARFIGVTPTRVNQLKSRALKDLREGSHGEILGEFLAAI